MVERAQREGAAVAVRDVVPQLHAVHVVIVVATEVLAKGHVVQVQEPTGQRHRLVVARIVLRHEAQPGGLVAFQPQQIEDLVVELRFAGDLEVLLHSLRPHEPVAHHATRVPPDQRVQLGGVLERNAGAEVVVVVVLDVPVEDAGDDAIVILGPAGPRERSGDRRVGARVLAGEEEHRRARLLVEIVDVATDRAERGAELRIHVEHRREEPGRTLLRHGLGGVGLRERRDRDRRQRGQQEKCACIRTHGVLR